MPDPRLAAVLAAGAVLLAGCGGDDTSAKPVLPSQTTPKWNPCDAIDSGLVRDAFGTVAKEEDGTPTAPQCRFAPAADSGEAAVVASYLLFSGTLDEAWQTMGQKDDADVRRPDIPAADDARIVVSTAKKSIAVSGFVQNGDLIQSLNVVDPAPYDEDRLVSGAERILTAFSRHADDAGAGVPGQ